VHYTAMQTLSFLLSKFIVIDDVPAATAAITTEWIEPKNVLN